MINIDLLQFYLPSELGKKVLIVVSVPWLEANVESSTIPEFDDSLNPKLPP